MTASDLAERLHRKALTLQEYQFDIEYRSGKTNAVADALPRAPVRRVATRILAAAPVETVEEE